MSEAAAEKKAGGPLIVGRYALFDELAAGGMATVHLARLLANEGPGRTVAVKRLHAQYTKDTEFCTMFMDEARLVTRIKHPHCVRTVDVVQTDEGLFLVMEYVHGESLSRLMRTARERKEAVPPKLVATLVHNALLGLHSAHEVTGDDGKLLNVVHRDVSPQNIIVGVDGAAKVLDFGIAKAAGRMQTTREGQIKGKLAYMAPEQIRGQVDRRTDVFAAAVVLWEALAGRRLHEGLKDVEIVTRVVQGKFVPPSQHVPEIPPELDQIVLKGLASDPKKRYLTAKDMASDIESKIGLMDRTQIGRWVERLAKPMLDKRAMKVSAMERAAEHLRPSSPQIRMPALSTPDAFIPVPPSAIDASAESRSETEVKAELDALAPTTPPPYTPSPDVMAAARAPAAKPPVPKAPPPKASTAKAAATSPAPKPPPPPVRPPSASGSFDDVTIPKLGTAPTLLASAAAGAPKIDPPVGAPLPNVPATSPGPNDTANTQHTQLTPSGTEVPLLAAAEDAEPAPPPRRTSWLYIAVAASLLLALAGAALGGYALARRTPGPPEQPTPKVSPPNPNVTTPPVPSPTTDLAPAPSATTTTTTARLPSSAVAPTTSASANAEPAPVTSATPDAADEPSTDLDPSPAGSAAPTATAKKHVVKPNPPSCDPPFVLDEHGNKKFKPECMGF